MIMNCKSCNAPFVGSVPRKQYCSKKCRTDYYNAMRPNARYTDIASSTTGAISELICCKDLMLQKFEVFRSQSPTCSCDLIAMKHGLLYRVEVTTVRRNYGGNFAHSKHKDRHKFDILACVLIEENLIYYETSRIVELISTADKNDLATSLVF